MNASCLLVTCDEDLLEDVLRLAAAAGTRLDVAHDAEAALRGWPTASVVLLGADLAAAVAGADPPRRDQVHVVRNGPVSDGLYQAALEAGAESVVELPAADGWVVETLADAVDGGVTRAPLVGVMAGSGGAGATTMTCALAATSARQGPTLAVDLDRFGPGLDRVAGLDEAPGVRWDALLSGSGRLGSRSLREALPRRDDLALLTWSPADQAPLPAAAVREVLAAAQRGHRLVVADLPRAGDEVTGEVVARCDRVVLVARADVPAVVAAGRVAARLREVQQRLALVVRTDCGSIEPERVAAWLDLPLLATVGRQRALAEQVDLGLGPVRSRRTPWGRAARAVLAEIAEPSR